MTLGSLDSVHLVSVTSMTRAGSSAGSPSRTGTCDFLLEILCLLGQSWDRQPAHNHHCFSKVGSSEIVPLPSFVAAATGYQTQ